MFHHSKDKPLTERQQRIYDFINSNRTGVITSIGANNQPHGCVIYHSIDKQFNVSFLTKKGTQKYENLLKNNKVMLVVFELASQTVVQVTGRAREVKNRQTFNQILESILMTSFKTSNGGIPPIAKLDAGECTAFMIEPDQIRMASYVRPDTGGYDQMFESIESFDLNAMHA